MRFTIQYIPLSKIKPDYSVSLTTHIRKLRHFMWDCMHLLVVRKNRKDGTYMILLGNDRYEFFRNQTKKIKVPCLVDENKPDSQVKSRLYKLRNKRLSALFPDLKLHSDYVIPSTWSIVNRFLKEEPRFNQLSRKQQIHVLWLAVRYKRIVVASMKAKVDQILSE